MVAIKSSPKLSNVQILDLAVTTPVDLGVPQVNKSQPPAPQPVPLVATSAPMLI